MGVNLFDEPKALIVGFDHCYERFFANMFFMHYSIQSVAVKDLDKLDDYVRSEKIRLILCHCSNKYFEYFKKILPHCQIPLLLVANHSSIANDGIEGISIFDLKCRPLRDLHRTVDSILKN